MTNATSILVNDLTANGSIVAPTAQVLDTGTAAVTLDTADLAGDWDRIFVEVTNLAAASLSVTVAAATESNSPPAYRWTMGDVVGASQAQNVRRIHGPFEAARFSRSGKLRLTFTPASGTINATFVAYRLPRSA